MIECYARCRVFVTIKFWKNVGLCRHYSFQTRFFSFIWMISRSYTTYQVIATFPFYIFVLDALNIS